MLTRYNSFMFRTLQFSLKNIFVLLRQPKPFGWTVSLTWTLCILPVFLLLLHPFDAKISVVWSQHTTKFQEILATSTNMIKSAYWLILAVFLWFLSVLYPKRQAGQTILRFIAQMREAGLYLFFAIIVASIPVNLMKYLIGRARPHLLTQLGDEYFSPFNGSYLYVSFPSGHAMMAGILAVFSLKFLPRLSWLIMPICLLLTFSRVIVAAHYPTDILAGFTIGVVVSLWLYNFLTLRNIITPVEKR